MKTTIKLGKDLVYYTNRITNVFTTEDYTGRLIDAYRSHVKSFYDQDRNNQFTRIYQFCKVASDQNIDPTPCETPLEDIEDARDALQDIIDNRAAYSAVIGDLISLSKGAGPAGKLMADLLSVLRKSSKNFHSTALNYDRYLGNEFSVADVILTVKAYGDLTGLVDYYNFEEGKD